MALSALLWSPVAALETSVSAPGASDELTDKMRDGALVYSANERGLSTAQEILSAARSDYATLVAILYAEGYFAPVVSIRLDGREAADIPALEQPKRIDRAEITVETGPSFKLGEARIAPLAPGTELPEGFAPGAPANTFVLQQTSQSAIAGWRAAGHAKARISSQNITAQHDAATLNARIGVTPGPQMTFGKMSISGNERVRSDAIARIAGFPTGTVFSPAEVRKVARRLRRTGAFTSVSLREAETANPDNTLDFGIEVSEQLPRRLSFGGEIATEEGISLSFNWIHRNLFGGAERLRFDSRISNIGGSEDIDGGISLRLDRPAYFGPDFDLFYLAALEQRNEPNYSLLRGMLAIGVRRTYSENLYAELAVGPTYGDADDAFGNREFTTIAFPGQLEWDMRNDKINASEGFYLRANVMPYLGVSGTKSGIYAQIDGRGYLALGPTDRFVLAGRAQLGTVLGPSLPEISPDLLFYSGGAGTVRGQPYQSLGIPIGDETAGGRSFLGASLELRTTVTEQLGLVAFYDVGAVDADQFVSSDSRTHSGAGLGVRYDIGGIGALRLDLAMPVSGPTGDGLQFYIGIGQAF